MKSIIMDNSEQDIIQLRTQIQQEKENVKLAIKNGAIFDDVKAKTLQIKELERKLENLEMAQKSLVNKS